MCFNTTEIWVEFFKKCYYRVKFGVSIVSLFLFGQKKLIECQRGKLMPSRDRQSTKLLSISQFFQQIDPFVEDILIFKAHVTFYQSSLSPPSPSLWSVLAHMQSRKDVKKTAFFDSSTDTRLLGLDETCRRSGYWRKPAKKVQFWIIFLLFDSTAIWFVRVLEPVAKCIKDSTAVF